MKSYSKTPLFLMELILMLLFFSFSAAICLQIFAGAKRISEENRRLDYAVMQAQTVADYWKASHGNLKATADRMGANVETDKFMISEDWFEMTCSAEGSTADIVVLNEGEEIFSLVCEAVMLDG